MYVNKQITEHSNSYTNATFRALIVMYVNKQITEHSNLFIN